jgi:hypothetical protein
MKLPGLEARRFTYFVFDEWDPDLVWASVAISNFSLEHFAQNYFWEIHRERILEKLSALEQQGFEPAGCVGAESITVFLAKTVEAKIEVVDIMLWIVSFGLLWLMQRLSREKRRYLIYQPIEFRLKLYCPLEDAAPA